MSSREVYRTHFLQIGLQLCIFNELLLVCLLALELAAEQIDL